MRVKNVDTAIDTLSTVGFWATLGLAPSVIIGAEVSTTLGLTLIALCLGAVACAMFLIGRVEAAES